MTKNTIEKIITHNRRGFAVHQIWAKFDELERKHAETLRLLEEMIEEEVEGPFFHEDEHGPESVLNRARAHLAAQKGSK